MPDQLSNISTLRTPQNQQADPRQIPNAAGGWGFGIDDLTRLRRFLVLGTEGGTYYTSARKLTADNARVVLGYAQNRPEELLEEVRAISLSGRAPRQNPVIFALAAAASLADDAGRKDALALLPAVCRTGTHLFTFAGYVQQFRGWGRGLRRAVASWYENPVVDKVAYQAVKYRQRDGWTHRDLLRLSHPAAFGRLDSPDRRALFDWICGRGDGSEDLPPIVEAYQRAQTTRDPSTWAVIIGLEPALTWEMLPDEALTYPLVWQALIGAGMPQTALMRQLPRLTRLGLFDAYGGPGTAMGQVVDQLTDPERLARGRVHPINVLVAARTYASGEGRGSTWTPSPVIIDALDAAFYASYGAVPTSGKRIMLALDVSGSMTQAAAGLPLTCREATAAMALVTANVEPAHQIVGFTANGGNYWNTPPALTPLPISSRQRLSDAVRSVSDLPFGGTDCSLPMLHAMSRDLPVDLFVVYTDNETWAGGMHPQQALAEYRRHTGIDARLAVVAMTASDVSIADPADPGMLDVAGFDSAVPNLLTDFASGVV